MSSVGIVRTALFCLVLQSLSLLSKEDHEVTGRKTIVVRRKKHVSLPAHAQHNSHSAHEQIFPENGLHAIFRLESKHRDIWIGSRRKRRSAVESITDEDEVTTASADRRRQLYNAFLRRMLRNWPRTHKKRKQSSKQKKKRKSDTSTTKTKTYPDKSVTPTPKHSSLHERGNRRSSSLSRSSSERSRKNPASKRNRSEKGRPTPQTKRPNHMKKTAKGRPDLQNLSPELQRQILIKRTKEERLRRLRKLHKREKKTLVDTSVGKQSNKTKTNRGGRPRLSVSRKRHSNHAKTNPAASHERRQGTTPSVKPKADNRTTSANQKRDLSHEKEVSERKGNKSSIGKIKQSHSTKYDPVSNPSKANPFISEPRAKDYLTRLDSVTQRKKLPRVAPLKKDKKKLDGRKRKLRTKRPKKRKRRKNRKRKRRKRKRGLRRKTSSPNPMTSPYSVVMTSTWEYSSSSVQHVGSSSTESYLSTTKNQMTATTSLKRKKAPHQDKPRSTTPAPREMSSTIVKVHNRSTKTPSVIGGIGNISTKRNQVNVDKEKNKVVHEHGSSAVTGKQEGSTDGNNHTNTITTPSENVHLKQTKLNNLSMETTTSAFPENNSTEIAVSEAQDNNNTSQMQTNDLTDEEINSGYNKENVSEFNNTSSLNETNNNDSDLSSLSLTLEYDDFNVTASNETQTTENTSTPNYVNQSTQDATLDDTDNLTERTDMFSTSSTSTSLPALPAQTSDSLTTTAQTESTMEILTEISTSTSQLPTVSTSISQSPTTTLSPSVSRWIAWARRRRNRAKKKSKSRTRKIDRQEQSRGGVARGSVAISLARKEKKASKMSTSVRPITQPPTTKGPFVGYKTAYDFLSNQRGLKVNLLNEERRESNIVNRLMGEQMCAIFNKHFVPTKIGGKCV